MEKGASEASSLYLDLFKTYGEQKNGFSPFTQATHACVALREALEELEDQGGWESRRERYRAISRRLRQELAALGIESFLPEEAGSVTMSSFKLPRGMTYQGLHDILREEGFVIYAGPGGLYHAIFRIANMGDILDSDVDRLINVFRALMNRPRERIAYYGYNSGYSRGGHGNTPFGFGKRGSQGFLAPGEKNHY